MKEQINRLYQSLITITLLALLQACGGSSNSNDTVTYSISADTTDIAFSHEILQTPTEEVKVDVTFDGNGLLIGFPPDAAPNAFVKYRTENVTSTSATVYVSLTGTDNLAPTTINTTLRLSTGDVDQVNLVHHDIDLSILIWQLTTPESELTFKGTFGDASIPPQTLAIISEDNSWTASTDVDWLTLENAAGSGNGEVTITPDISAFTTSGLSTASITLTETTSGDTKTIPVELGLDNIHLFANQQAVSFLNSANAQSLSTTIDVGTNFTHELDWQATTEANWLVLTPDTANQQLAINVDTNNVPQAQWSETTVSISATENNQVISFSLPVTLFNTSEEIANQTLTNISINEDALVSLATKPHVYVGSENRLDIYHQYTRELLASHTVAPESTQLTQFILHPTENHVLAKAVETTTDDQGNETQVTHRYRISTTDFNVETLENVTIEFEPIKYVSIAGRHFVITELLELADDNLSLIYWDVNNAFFTTLVDFASSTGFVYALDLRDSTFNRFKANVNDFTAESIDISMTHQYRPELLDESSAVRNFVVDDNERNIYAISPTSEWLSFDGTSYTDNGLLEQTNDLIAIDVFLSTDNKAHYVRGSQAEGIVVDIYDNEQNRQSSIATNGLFPDDTLLTHDNKQLVLYSDSGQQLEFIVLP